MTFIISQQTHLKICGVTNRADAERLIEMGVHALGFNFWPPSKRYLNPQNRWMNELSEKIWKVGVFVNQEKEFARSLFDEGMINVVQLHGDEEDETIDFFLRLEIPVIKAQGVKTLKDINKAESFRSDAILLDTHAPVVFGGTGQSFDWSLAQTFQQRNPSIPLILAGGITPENAKEAIQTLHPFMLDVASGAEISPGIKDFPKVEKLLAACNKLS